MNMSDSSKINPVEAAAELRGVLIKHDKVVKMLQELEFKIESISRRVFADGFNSSRDMSVYYLHLSVANGVKSKLEKCRCQINQRVKKLSRQIIIAIQADDNSNIEQMDLFEDHVTSPVPMDTSAIQYTRNMTMSFRGN